MIPWKYRWRSWVLILVCVLCYPFKWIPAVKRYIGRCMFWAWFLRWT